MLVDSSLLAEQLTKLPQNPYSTEMKLDNPNDADLYGLQLKHGDVIILYVSILDIWPNEP